MRVLHLYAGNLYGGIERLLATYAEQRELCPQLEPTFALCFEGKLAEQIRASGAPLYMLPSVRLSRPWTTWQSRRTLGALLDRLPAFDAVLTHASWPHAVFAPVMARRKRPIIFVAHDAYQRLTWIDRAAAKVKPTGVIANSAFTAAMIPHLFRDVPCAVCHCPVASPPVLDRTTLRREVRSSLNCPAERVVIVCTARMEHWKGQHLLIEALSRLQGDQWEAWIGGGTQRPEEEKYLASLKLKAEQYGIQSRIRFLGQRGDVPKLLAAADIHCQPNSGPEPFGIAFIEALFTGLPVVTTRLGAPAELIDSTCGVLVEPGNAEMLAEALRRLIDHPAEREAIGKGGPSRADKLCNVERQLRKLHDIIGDQLGGRDRSA